VWCRCSRVAQSSQRWVGFASIEVMVLRVGTFSNASC
jgi:hypothetical protein